MSVDWNKPIQTRGGISARLLGVRKDPNRGYTQVVAVGDTAETIQMFPISGVSPGSYSNAAEDIINVPVTKTFFRNVYPDHSVTHHNYYDVAVAKAEAGDKVLGTVKFTTVDGVLKSAEVV